VSDDDEEVDLDSGGDQDEEEHDRVEAWYEPAGRRATGAAALWGGAVKASSERAALVGLHLIPYLTPTRLERLTRRLGSVGAVWEASERSLGATLGDAGAARRIAAARSEELLERELALASAAGIEIATVLDASYPEALRELPAPPSVLYIRGDRDALGVQAVAVVGTRRATGYGRRIARRVAADLAAAGIVVVSGLAMGIDAAAHRGALATGGTTVAIIGCGLLQRLPSWQSELADAVAASGALVSQFPLEMSPTRWSFPRRNRVLAGLSRAVIVVEAPERSGALITADWALRQGKDVYAVPGNLTSITSVGCNRLIKDGAGLLEGVADVLLGLGMKRVVPCEHAEDALARLGPRERLVYDRIGLDPVHIDAIIAEGDLSPAEAAHILLVLEMADLVSELDGKRFVRAG